jgi:hypothetical protein
MLVKVGWADPDLPHTVLDGIAFFAIARPSVKMCALSLEGLYIVTGLPDKVTLSSTPPIAAALKRAEKC